jgi:hypothetical protein
LSFPRLPARFALANLAIACTVTAAASTASYAAQAQPPQGCTAPRILVERFISADCEACWHKGAALGGEALALDWIVPSAAGEEAPLAAAAIVDATPRAGTMSASHTHERRHDLRPADEFELLVEDGPGWNGYIAARIRVDRHARRSTLAATAGAVAYLALVEQVRAGEEGTPVDRMLVRSVAGPLPLDAGAARVTHLRAFRIAPGSKPARLTAIGWVEGPGGVVLAATGVEPDVCMPAR